MNKQALISVLLALMLISSPFAKAQDEDSETIATIKVETEQNESGQSSIFALGQMFCHSGNNQLSDVVGAAGIDQPQRATVTLH